MVIPPDSITTVRVIYRRWKCDPQRHSVIAYLMDEGGHSNDMITIYQHIGQHGEMRLDDFLTYTYPADYSSREVNDLREELVRRGYEPIDYISPDKTRRVSHAEVLRVIEQITK